MITVIVIRIVIMIYKITGMMILSKNQLSNSIEFIKIKIIKINKKENQIIIVLLIEDKFKILWLNKT